MGVKQVIRKKRRAARCRRRYGAGHCPHRERHSRDRGRSADEVGGDAEVDADWFKPAF